MGQVEEVSRQNHMVSQKMKAVEAKAKKDVGAAIKARDITRNKLVTEESKVSALTKENERLKAAEGQHKAEKGSLIDEHQRQVKELEGKIQLAETDAAQAEEVTKTWHAASDMFENVLSNLHQMVAPILPTEMEETYRGWLATIKLPVREPKEVVHIAPETYDDEDLEGEGDPTTPAGDLPSDDPMVEDQQQVPDANDLPPVE